VCYTVHHGGDFGYWTSFIESYAHSTYVLTSMKISKSPSSPTVVFYFGAYICIEARMTCNFTYRHQHHYRYRCSQYSFLILMFIAIGFATAADERKEEVRPDRYADVDQFDNVRSVVRNVFVITCAPVVILFLSSLFRDPVFPRILKAAWKSVITKKVLGNLSCGDRDGSSSSRTTDV